MTTTTTIPTAKEQLADLERRLADIPGDRDALTRERAQVARAGPGAIARVRQIDAHLSELETEEEVLQASRPAVVRRIQQEHEHVTRLAAAEIDLRRHELLVEARPIVDGLLRSLGKLDELVAARQITADELPTVVHWLQQLRTSVAAEWPAALGLADQQARAARVLLNGTRRAER